MAIIQVCDLNHITSSGFPHLSFVVRILSDLFGVVGDRIATNTTAKAPAEVREEDFEEFSGIDVNFMPKRHFDFLNFNPTELHLG